MKISLCVLVVLLLSGVVQVPFVILMVRFLRLRSYGITDIRELIGYVKGQARHLA